MSKTRSSHSDAEAPYPYLKGDAKEVVAKQRQVAEKTIEDMDKLLNEQHDQAIVIIDDYWQWMLKETATKEKDDKNNLCVRARRTTTGVTIQWYYNKWYRADESWKPMSKYIKKGRTSVRYKNAALKKHARDWDWDRVVETEDRLSEIRYVVQKITDTRRAAGILIKKYKELEKLL